MGGSWVVWVLSQVFLIATVADRSATHKKSGFDAQYTHFSTSGSEDKPVLVLQMLLVVCELHFLC